MSKIEFENLKKVTLLRICQYKIANIKKHKEIRVFITSNSILI